MLAFSVWRESRGLAIALRLGLEDIYERKITFEKREAAAHLTSRRLTRSLWRLFRRRETANDQPA